MLSRSILALSLPFMALSWSIRHPFHRTPTFNSVNYHSCDHSYEKSSTHSQARVELPTVFQLNVVTPDGLAGIRLIRDDSFPGPDYPYPILAPPNHPDSPRLVLREGRIWIKDSNLIFGRSQTEDRSLNPKQLMFGDPHRMIPLEFDYQDIGGVWALKLKENYASGMGIIASDRRLYVQLYDRAPLVKLIATKSVSGYETYQEEYLDLKK